jgi:hypothetical protein
MPGLGFPLGTRAQMFWLDAEHPNALARSSVRGRRCVIAGMTSSPPASGRSAA